MKLMLSSGDKVEVKLNGSGILSKNVKTVKRRKMNFCRQSIKRQHSNVLPAVNSI